MDPLMTQMPNKRFKNIDELKAKRNIKLDQETCRLRSVVTLVLRNTRRLELRQRIKVRLISCSFSGSGIVASLMHALKTWRRCKDAALPRLWAGDKIACKKLKTYALCHYGFQMVYMIRNFPCPKL